MRAVIVRIGLAVFAAAAAWGAAIHNPHGASGAEDCSYCHTPALYEQGASASEPQLIFSDIDALCLSCHMTVDCCRVEFRNQPKLHIGEISHPSGIRVRRTEHRPRRLPTYQGRITCSTCHLHERDDPRNVGRVRLIEVYTESGNAIWDPLCADCHEDY